MRIRNFGVAAALAMAALGLSACAQSLNTQVSRYQAMPAPQGQTFTVVPIGGMATTGGLEFQRYAGIVAQQLQARGYQPAATGQSANMVVQLGYSLDRGQVRVEFGPLLRQPLRLWRVRLQPVLLPALRPLWVRIAFLLRLGRPVPLRRRRDRQLGRVSKRGRPPHPCVGNQPAAVRRTRTGAIGDQSARRARPESGRGPVHWIPGPERRDGQDHHSGAPARLILGL